MTTTEIANPAQNLAAEDPPLDLVLARQNLMKLGMYAHYAPSSAQYLRDCIAHELERAERILLERMGCVDAERHLLDIMEARCALARSWH
jgi:hypothetical protein